MPIQTLCKIADDFGVRKISDVILADPRFPLWSGASEAHQHHYGKFGLAKHTLEVVELCLMNNAYFVKDGKNVDNRLLFLAALFHDAGKMWDYQATSGDYHNWEGTRHKRIIHHVSRSALVWQQACNGFRHLDFLKDGEDEVLHAILAHHGRREWGSPVSPNTRLAWLLHLCDGISARVYDCYTWDRRL